MKTAKQISALFFTLLILISALCSFTGCKTKDTDTETELESEPKTKTIAESYDIIYDWLIENGTLKNGTEVSYRYKNEDTYVLIKYDSNFPNSIYFYMHFPDHQGNTLYLTYTLEKNDDQGDHFYFINLSSNNNRAYASKTYSLDMSNFTKNTPTKYCSGRNSSTVGTFGFTYTSAEKQEGEKLSNIINDIHYDCLITFLNWLRDDFCPTVGLTMKDLGFLKYK
jgi:hypothetical protein